MPSSKVKNLGTLIHSGVKTITAAVKSTGGEIIAAADAKLKLYVSSLDTSTQIIPKRTNNKLFKSKKSVSNSSSTELPKLNLGTSSSKSDSPSSSVSLSEGVSSILCGNIDDDGSSTGYIGTKKDKPMEEIMGTQLISNISDNSFALRRKGRSIDRKQSWIFKSTRGRQFDRLINLCGEKLGTDATLHVFGMLGKDTGVKEYNAFIAICIEEAKKTNDEEVSLQQTSRAFRLLKLMKEQGFPLEDETYGPFLMYLIEMRLIKEFHFFCDMIKENSPTTLSRLGYYEMLLWIHLNNEEKIKELCSCSVAEGHENISGLLESYLLALCECNRTPELLQLLKVIDIHKFSSVDDISAIFKSLGRLSMESYAEKFILVLKNSDNSTKNCSHFIFNYVLSLPNLSVEDEIIKFKDLHTKLDVAPSSITYEKLIIYCCDTLKVHVALKTVDQMYEAGLTLSIETFNSILRASEECCEFNLVRRIYSVINLHNLKPNTETFRCMITLSVKMKDFEGAYGMLKDLEKLKLPLTATIYNAMMLGYFRKKNISGAMCVLKQMVHAGVNPDSQTFSYLINNCVSEEEIIKLCEELKSSKIQMTRQIYMSLVNAYASCGQFEKAKQVVLDKRITADSLNIIKSSLVSALASHGQVSDAILLYNEMKQSGISLQPKAIISLIEHIQSEGKLGTMLELLKDLNDPNNLVDGCSRVILYCIRYKLLSSAIDLIKQLKDDYCEDELAMYAICDEVFAQVAEIEPIDVQIGMDLLHNMKEKLELVPSRKCLDFLLAACVIAKDLDNGRLVWKEYQITGLPYNVLSYLRMYQCLLTSGDKKSAENMLKKIPKDDPHVRLVIQACQTTYADCKSIKEKKKKTKKRKKIVT